MVGVVYGGGVVRGEGKGARFVVYVLGAVVAQKARLVAAEAQIPQAIADAFRSGNLGVMDYYNLRNIQADTRIRDSIGGDEDTRTSPLE